MNVMMWKLFILLVLMNARYANSTEKQTQINKEQTDDLEQQAQTLLYELDEKYFELLSNYDHANWDFQTNITEESIKRMDIVSLEISKFMKYRVEKVNAFPWKNLTNNDLKLKFELIEMSKGPDNELKEQLQQKLIKMQVLFAETKNINSNKDGDKMETLSDLNLKVKDLLQKFEDNSQSYEKLREPFMEYVRVSNALAKSNNFNNFADLWRAFYQTKCLKNDVLKLWGQIKPLYLQIHAYVRHNLQLKFGKEIITAKGPIPHHLQGLLYLDFYPFSNSSINLTDCLIKKNYTVPQMFHVAEDFFTSMGLSAMPESFWTKSLLENPNDGRLLDCHASAWDFGDGKDFRIKQCSKIDGESFRTAHHEMGHVQYFLQYKDQPRKYQDGANDAFHEAIGDLIALSAITRYHLTEIGLISENTTEFDQEHEINDLYILAFNKVFAIPQQLTFDLWRWDLFEGNAQLEDMNCHYWKIREEIEGIEPGIDRKEEDVDWVSYHTVTGASTIRYFISNIIQFQFHRALCKAAGQLDNGVPLYKCNIYGNKKAGQLLGNMLKLGSSKPWPEAMQMLTGQSRMDASALREYFAPLEEWLRAENKRTGAFVGWEKSQKLCSKSI